MPSDKHAPADPEDAIPGYRTDPGSLVLVAGATGGVGQLVCAKLLERGMRVRALCRSEERAARLLGRREGLEVALGDVRQPSTLRPAFQAVQAVACAMGTTAFPTLRWLGNNTPAAVNEAGTRALIDAAQEACPAAPFVLVSSAGVERADRLPYSILNAGGVLTAMAAAEAALRASGLAYTIVRPGRLTDGPYTSYDINTLLKGVAGQRQAVQLASRDVLDGEASRIAVAELVVQALVTGALRDTSVSISSTTGSGPGDDTGEWKKLFQGLA
ncbi:Uncharacterized protein, chloroplastic [Auxenochlorella protothecoides]|uniref:Uncharacterized protein, chloroplastic n=1 Tax=Auxenochlorella protothecoides TaxID=3075 RepID=A0A087SSP9_AUXPR|nr:Uncharacterized protein, chloroplastic [Auxenochlorella protothecoides]KFM28753.1 Uncharacterized protein, chloroplastic [Auxenochlorella protothecoides]RMZ55618.1 hypothetical protein APUTEX25_000201 [Auxenochlorella protothecoides]|eukprot:RMZ55618.1 hypothetical protein APUTEX25_000201 [Auxenochlorella protothecoides]